MCFPCAGDVSCGAALCIIFYVAYLDGDTPLVCAADTVGVLH